MGSPSLSRDNKGVARVASKTTGGALFSQADPVRPSDTSNIFVERQVEHGVVIRATTRSTCNETMLPDKLNKNVARITGPLRTDTLAYISSAYN